MQESFFGRYHLWTHGNRRRRYVFGCPDFSAVFVLVVGLLPLPFFSFSLYGKPTVSLTYCIISMTSLSSSFFVLYSTSGFVITRYSPHYVFRYIIVCGISLQYHKQFYSSVGNEELNHVEMIGAILYQLTKNLSPDEVKAGGMDKYFVDHTLGVYPASADGVPFDAKYIASKGDAIADLTEDLAAEQKARVTYDNILRLSDDPDVNDVIKFLRQREIVHFQRFADILRRTQESLDQKNYYAFNPSYMPKGRNR